MSLLVFKLFSVYAGAKAYRPNDVRSLGFSFERIQSNNSKLLLLKETKDYAWQTDPDELNFYFSATCELIGTFFLPANMHRCFVPRSLQTAHSTDINCIYCKRTFSMHADYHASYHITHLTSMSFVAFRYHVFDFLVPTENAWREAYCVLSICRSLRICLLSAETQNLLHTPDSDIRIGIFDRRPSTMDCSFQKKNKILSHSIQYT